VIPKIKNLEYEDRLKSIKLPSLMYHRRRGDLIEEYKYRHNVYKVDSSKLLPLKVSTKETRGHPHKLDTARPHLEIRKKFVSLRVTKAWNALPKNAVEAPSVNAFKGRIDRHLRNIQYSTELPLPVGGVVGSDSETQTESTENNETNTEEPS
jgi:hypothetical protein